MTWLQLFRWLPHTSFWFSWSCYSLLQVTDSRLYLLRLAPERKRFHQKSKSVLSSSLLWQTDCYCISSHYNGLSTQESSLLQQKVNNYLLLTTLLPRDCRKAMTYRRMEVWSTWAWSWQTWHQRRQKGQSRCLPILTCIWSASSPTRPKVPVFGCLSYQTQHLLASSDYIWKCQLTFKLWHFYFHLAQVDRKRAFKAFDPWSWSTFPPPSNSPCQHWNHSCPKPGPHNSGQPSWSSLVICSSQMKPLFSKMGEEEVYHPGDPGRTEFEDKWMLAGGKLEELEGQVIRLSNTEVAKVSPFHACCLQCCSHSSSIFKSLWH